MSDQTRDPGAKRYEQDASRVRETAEREARSAADNLSEGAATLKQEASAMAANVAGKAKTQAYESAESGKDFAAGNMEDFAAAIRKASDELGERDQSMSASLLREAARSLESASREVKGKSVEDMMRSVAGFARRQPGAFLIGATLAGVALGRFARASGDHDHPGHSGDHGRGRDYRPGEGQREPFGYRPEGPSRQPAAASTAVGGRPATVNPTSATTSPAGATPSFPRTTENEQHGR
ncbi:hypothetical protein [Consotaella salsifontis]|uniref:Uncharacterized protein n=1 Tax=Consotaella salsifontis TaxID=1365950 RepID=A0A1T4T8T0_9HYPH|nr:hypothetical protein [Consotaella salsifontis]SKA36719.1 hypothetical protein SAMN05428963_1216 [Consotaella salsifontis]